MKIRGVIADESLYDCSISKTGGFRNSSPISE
eukprot:CAMPEP_0176356612 /NCGR_PEP_ID=MMETSP0126-20121128/14142_1 /TAXON_ID=141414 ORGANISM="Strombidinopsis acuminatum, Strain SPMC142" /NCGR_SAMPLE_ID=MMETSP0126 /ASSEMBLY_ACC=CAM_ASM_000229 /LENGTH=31 /DNA_ID= /DNA_START= /DNA_END= /DNA_ORIENTATION=